MGKNTILRKHRLPALLLLLVCLVLAGAMTARAEELWSDNYFRALDTTEQLSDAQQTSIDDECIEFMRKYSVDFACLSLAPEHHDETSFRELADEFYEKWEYGYGDTKDGFFFLFDTQSMEGEIFPYGNAAGMIPDSYLEWTVQSSLKFYEKFGVYGVMYGGVKYTTSYLEDHAGENTPETAAAGAGAIENNAGAAVTGAGTGETESAAAETVAAGTTEAETSAGNAGAGVWVPEEIPDPPEINQRVGEGNSMPAWYPVNPGNFDFYHDENAPRVVDDADIFTDEEEARMEKRLSEIRGELDRDIVIYTNKSACGLDHHIMAADFFDYNGYGCGDDYEGVCLYICMDPEDRGWFAACSGADTMGLYTEEYANDIDDVLYDYMVRGDYGEGVLDWIENFRGLYENGFPFAPDWYPARGEAAPARFHDSEAPRIRDDSGLLTEEQVRELTEYAKKISDTYGLDVVVHTAPRSAGMDRQDYAKLFYEYNGYGFGENYDGILLMIFKREGYTSTNRIYASGKGLDKLTEVNRKRMRDFVTDSMDSHNYYGAIKTFLRQTEHMERTGRVPRSAFYWIIMSILGAVGGAIFGGVALVKASLRMAVPKVQENADAYLVKGSLEVKNLGEVFLGSSVSSKYIPPVSRSSGGGSSSSGRSSYHSSYSGSSGRSHSGSGRRF
ncbi:MAG: TPM domain-containing protein [Stomatobaculum sp.]|nr:TPM domain-containing protein [Stomatobaculum sp.]